MNTNAGHDSLDSPGPAPRTDEECCPGKYTDDGFGQPVPAAQATADQLRNKAAQNTPAADDERKRGKFGVKLSLKNKVPRIRVQKTGSSTKKSGNR
ncbi:hypothetical protein SAMN06296273_1371 [Nitrosomonas ureae]|uniref:Uncharacterized protein n=1 Tax=Nitrosomonas ureae TaxID=44577 RepID=A0A285BXW9_9PROT|nr:hypothetical protein SAMN06296273_1371 [Nitrosomonas ureae]